MKTAVIAAVFLAGFISGHIVEGKVVEDFNGKFGWVMDPEGNKIELWEPKPGF